MSLRKLFLRLNDRCRRIKVVRADDSALAEDTLLHLALTSPFEADILWDSRNVVWRTSIAGMTCVVKTFCGGVGKSLIYSVKRSKARRSFAHAVELIRRGIDTPRPLGFVEVRGLCNMLSHSCYASTYTPYIALTDAIGQYGDSVVDAFAVFIARLHRRGIRHDDLNGSNVRVGKDAAGRFTFSLIDLNRMKIYPAGHALGRREVLDNVCRFTYDMNIFRRFAASYIQATGRRASEADGLIEYKQKADVRFWRRKRYMHALGRLLGIKKNAR
ncbi:MAG: lipopolysaccharide kinase InaA family protein [Bacteroides sp.]|nr:lipopolysaccharide kinase InaA family protein [Bacteroides sp.]MCM1095804.1 lipopolysaccharide kinase InaA family protein [Terasakiella sp.]